MICVSVMVKETSGKSKSKMLKRERESISFTNCHLLKGKGVHKREGKSVCFQSHTPYHKGVGVGDRNYRIYRVNI